MIPSPQNAESRPVSTYRAATAQAPASVRQTVDRRERLLRLAGFAPAAFFLVMILLPPLNHDVAAVLDFSLRWLAGERLYVDLIDVNPPLIFVLNLVPAAMARWTSLSPAQAMVLCLLGVAALLWLLTEALRRGRPEGAIEAATLSACVPLLLLVAGSDFGQREILMAMVAIPYCLLAARRIEGPEVERGLALAVALAAAVGFALKPHFLAVPALVEGLVLLRRGPARALRDPVPWAMLIAWLAYLAAIPLFFPAYVTEVVPLAWAVYADIHGPGPWRVLLTDVMGAAWILLLVAVPAALRRQAGAFGQALAVAAVGAFLSAWVQHKGWTYHVLPMTILGCAALVVVGARWADHALPEGRARAAAPMLAAVAAFGILVYEVRGGETPWRQAAFHGETGGRLTEWLRREAFGQDVLVLSPDIFPVYPALTYAHARQTLHTMSIWPLQGAYRDCPAGPAPYREPGQMGRVEHTLFQAVAEDFATRPPAAMMVARHANMPACGTRFDLLDYFERHPLFAEALEGYRSAGEIDGYRLFVRAW
ncbi:hypothetical protein [Neoroseomonas soli]|uniref:Uncharacterized protein n=1 Tax=Neoroseomonas soli TaxID=1081025 RepID=A0A9X9WU14_9PROT|nr:hypothetical protein [Neoroseomonas soli]MBR0670643.1 hypothetical protein [Neoroseomonas soli]